MQYMLDGRTTTLMRLALGLTLLLLVAFWVATGLLYFTRMDLTPDSVVHYYLGSEEEFLMPRTYGSMIETTHMHLGMMAVVLLLLTHLTIFVPWPAGARITLVVATFTMAVASEGAGWLVRFVSPDWAPLKIVGFVGLEICLLVLFVGLGGWIVGVRGGGRMTQNHSRAVAPHFSQPPAAWSNATVGSHNGGQQVATQPSRAAARSTTHRSPTDDRSRS